jgi:hypothetical protein
VAVAAFAACALCWWLRVYAGAGDRVNLGNIDALIYWVPLMREAAAQWRSGAVPLWNPYQAFGTPLLANLQAGAAYPLNALYLLLDIGPAWLGTVVVHQLIAAVGMYAWCRALALSRAAALVGAAAFTFSAPVLSKYLDQPQFNSIAWAPALFWAAERLLATARPAAAVRLAGIWVLQILSGHPETIAYTATFLGGYVAVRLLGRVRHAPCPVLQLGLLNIMAAALALALTAFQLLPTAELVSHSVRSAGSLSPGQQALLSIDMDDLLGVAQGAPPLVFAVLGFWWWRRRDLAWLFAGSAATLAVLALGPATPLFSLLRHVPMGTWFRAPTRWLSLWPLYVAVLTGVAAEELSRAASEYDVSRRARTAAVAALLVVAARLTLASKRDLLSVWVPVSFELLALLVVGAAAWVPRRKGTGVWRFTGPSLALVLVYAAPVALFYWGPTYLSPFGVAEIYNRQSMLFGQLRVAAPARILSLLPVPLSPAKAPWAKLGTYFEVPVLNDVEPLSLVDFERFTEALRGPCGPAASPQCSLAVFTGEILPPTDAFDGRLLDLAGVRFVLAEAGRDQGLSRWLSGTPLVQQQRTGTVVVYQNDTAQPRAFFVGREHGEPAPPNCLKRLRVGDFDSAKQVLLDPAPFGSADVTGSSAASVRITADAPAQVEVEVSSSASGYVVVTDAFYPGWVATVDGDAAPVLRADCFFRAVPVAAGIHQIVLRYMPRSFAHGMLISIAALGLAMVTLVADRRRAEVLRDHRSVARA